MTLLARHAGFLTTALLSSALACAPVIAGAKDVPFTATLVTQETLTLDPVYCQAFPYLKGTTTGSGHATHLGAVTGTATDCVTPSAFKYMFANGTLTLTAANGDVLHAIYSGELTPSATSPMSVISGSYGIAGGTGRFAGATGMGTLSGLSNMQTGQGQFLLKGTINY